MLISLDHFRTEEERIRAAYDNRPSGYLNHLFHPGNLFMMQDQERQMLALLKRYGFSQLDAKEILEVGCGTGYWLREFIKWGARPDKITGIDLLPSRIELARELGSPRIAFRCGSAVNLESPDATYDIVLQSTVFTSILDSTMKKQIAGEMVRVLKPDGLIIWYDYCVSNPKNPDVRGITKREIYRLFPGCRIDLQRVTLAPPLSRMLAPYSLLLCLLLEKIPLLRAFYLGAITKGA